MSLVIHIVALLAVAEGLRTREQAVADPQALQRCFNNQAYTFDAFVQDFGRSYGAGSEEYSRRASTFKDSLMQICAKNSRARRSWTAGVHPFMDWTVAERAQHLHGYKPSGPHHTAKSARLAALQTRDVATSNDRIYGDGSDSFVNEAPPIRNQGACGSCWAIASVEAVEARLIKQGGPQLSPQALLDCVQNPRHCGGQGGCDGATPQLAFDFMRDNGLPLETNLPYHQGAADKCPLKPYPSEWARATLTGWRALPSNQAQPLMQALVKDGPVVVSVFAHDWYSYHSGIFDDCPKDAVPSHSVLATGYGVLDMSSGKHTSLMKYWVLQNSWGPAWGEQGSMRLVRQDDEDSWCGNDAQPQMGSACDDDPHQNVTVCGSCGILYDTVIPQVGGLDVPTPGQAREADKVEAIMDHYHASVDEPQQPLATPEAIVPAADTRASSAPGLEGTTRSPSAWWEPSLVPQATAATQPEEHFALQPDAVTVPDAIELPDVADTDQVLADSLAQPAAPDSDSQVSGATNSLFAMSYHASHVTDAMDAYEAGALQG